VPQQFVSWVKETATVSGASGAVTLTAGGAGAQTGYQSFYATYTTGNTLTYFVYDRTTFAWEARRGTYTSSSHSLSCDWFIASSTGSSVTFAGNACDIYPATPGERFANPYADADVFNYNPAAQLFNFRKARANVINGVASSRCKILCFGDSTTQGVTTGSTSNYRPTVSYPAQLVTALKAYGYPVQQDNFAGVPINVDSRIVLVGSAEASGAASLGGPLIQSVASSGDGADFTISTAATYDHVTVGYLDATGSFTVGLNGGTTQTVTMGNTGNIVYTDLAFTSGSHSVINIRCNAAGLFIQSAGFWNSANPSIEIINGGIGGLTTAIVGTGAVTNYGDFPGAYQYMPQLMILNLGTNDINNGSPSISSALSNMALIVSTMQSINCDILVILPEPFSSTNYASLFPQFRSGMQALSLQYNFPILDMSNRWLNSYSTAGNLMASILHPSTAGYNDWALKLADMLRVA
jgi:lysophospholipase L1-like esterase